MDTLNKRLQKGGALEVDRVQGTIASNPKLGESGLVEWSDSRSSRKCYGISLDNSIIPIRLARSGKDGPATDMTQQALHPNPTPPLVYGVWDEDRRSYLPRQSDLVFAEIVRKFRLRPCI